MQRHLAALLLGAAGVMFATQSARAAVTDPASAPTTLTVTGQGAISRSPDVATVAVTIVTNDDNAGRALSENNRHYHDLSVRLASAGIAPADLVSTSLNSYFNPRPEAASQRAPGQQYGFVVTRNVQVTVRALNTTGSIIDAASAAGATQINGVSYGFADARAVQRAAQAAAMGDAAAQAQAIAAAAHMQVVRILRIGGDEGGQPQPYFPAAMLARKAEAAVPTTITPSNVDVNASLTVTFIVR